MTVEVRHDAAAPAALSMPGAVSATELQAEPLVDSQTVAVVASVAPNRVPAMVQGRPPAGATTAERVLVAPPPMSSAPAATRDHEYGPLGGRVVVGATDVVGLTGGAA
jgi:hypothetical protein